MGGSASATVKGLDQAKLRAESRVGKITVTGRYHRPPKKLEDDYTPNTNQVLGSGYNGEVYVASARNAPGKKYAVKGFKLHGVTKEKREELIGEVEIFLAMDHPHVARLVDVYEAEDRLHLVMECMQGGELFARVSERKKYSEKDAAEAVNQMLLAINYIHSHGVVHRDLKLENFLYETKEGDYLKLIDFGFSKIWTPNTKLHLSCGTLSYVAPEVLDKNYTSQCDLWSLGVIVFILLVGYMPFHGQEATQMKLIKTGAFLDRKEKWALVSKTARQFVEALLVVDPGKRLTAEQALKHKFITDRDKVSEPTSVDAATLEALCRFGQASAFRRACLNVMAWSLTNEERSQVREAFLEMDQDRTGVIKLWEMKKVLEDRFHFADEQVVAIFKSLDTNHTDEIHYSEFLAAMCSTRIALHDDLLKQTFKRFDTDNSGFITKGNLEEVLGTVYDGTEVSLLIQEADIKHDGQISLEEFLQYMKEGHANEGHHEAAARVIDAHSGIVETSKKKMQPRQDAPKQPTQAAPEQVKVEVQEEKPGTKCSCVVL